MTRFKTILFSGLLLVASCSGTLLLLNGAHIAFQFAPITAKAGSSSFLPYCSVPPTCSLTASPNTLTGKGDVTLYWSAQNAVGGDIDGVSLPDASGHVPVTGISKTSTYTATFWNSIGDSVQCKAKVIVTPPPAPTCTLDASENPITQGDSTTLSWTTTHADTVTLEGDPVSKNSSESVSPNNNKTYTLDVSGPGGSVQCSKKVIVNPPQNGCIAILKETFDPNGNKLTPVAQFTFKLDGNAATAKNDANGDAIFTDVTPGVHTVTEVSAGSTWTQLSVTPANGKVTVASGPQCAGVVFKNKQVVTPTLSCTLSASPSSINPGDSSTLSWTTVGATSISINHNIGPVNPVSGGSVSVSPGSTTTYTATASNGSQSFPCSTSVTVVPLHYGPYCGDGSVNQAWEQCDGGASCNDKCQLGNQCTDLVLAKINITNVQNSPTKPGNMTSDLFIGGSATANKIPQGVWFALYYNGSYYTDPDASSYADVPGLSVQRLAGKIRAGMFGSYSEADKDIFNEHVEGNIETWQANVTTQENDSSAFTKPNKFESQGDGIKLLRAGQDEFWLSGGKSFFWSSVNTANDFFYTDYTKTSPTNCGSLPSCTLNSAPSSINSGDSSTLSWTTTNATSISIDHGIGSTTPVASGSASVSPASTTLYTATATNANGSAQCQTTVTVVNPNAVSCTLSIDKDNIATGDSATLSWTSTNAVSGFIDNNIGTTSPVSGGSLTIFPPSTTTYTGVFKSATGTTTQCTAVIHVNGGPGCSGSCGGGGLDQPNVSLFHSPGQQPLAFVSLSQIPYTGFEAGPALTMIFWLAIGLLSAFIAYLIVGAEAVHGMFASVISGVAGVPMVRVEPKNGRRPYPAYTEEDQYLSGMVAPIHAAPQHAPMYPAYAAPAPAAPAPAPSLHDVIESRAHAAGVLMSPEALSYAVSLSPVREETLRLFGDALNEAVRTIPREDGWIMLTAEALKHILAAKHFAAPAPEPRTSAPSVDANMASAFAGAVVSGDRTHAFSIIRSLEHDGLSPTSLMAGTATALDALYRSRKDGRSAPDSVLAEKAAHLSDEKLEHLVTVFAHSLDHTYASSFTGVKLALAQAFEVIG